MPRRGSSLYIRNIPDSCRHEDLRRTFGRFGPIVDVTIPTDYYSGRMKGFAFVEFEDPRDAEDAHRNMDHSRFLGRRIEVEFTRGVRKTPAEMRGRDRRTESNYRRRSRSPSFSPRRGSRRSRSISRGSEGFRRDYRDFSVSRSPSRSPGLRNGSKMRSTGDYDDRSFRYRNDTRDSHFSRRRGSGSRSRSPT